MAEETGTTSRVPPRKTRVGIVQKLSDTDSASYRGSGEVSFGTVERTRDAFLALHCSVLRIPSSVELSASSRASSQESLTNPNAVARWSERFEEAFQSEQSLDNTLDGLQEEEIEKRRKASAKVLNGHGRGLPPSESNTPILSIFSPDCHSITSESLTGFEFAVMNSNRTTLDHSATGKTTHEESAECYSDDRKDCCMCCVNCHGNRSPKDRSSITKRTCILLALLSVILIPFLLSWLLFNYGRSRKNMCSRRGCQISSVVYCLFTYLLLIVVTGLLLVANLCNNCIDTPW